MNSTALARQGLTELFHCWLCCHLCSFWLSWSITVHHIWLVTVSPENKWYPRSKEATFIVSKTSSINLVLLITKKQVGFTISACKIDVKTGSSSYMWWRSAWYWENREICEIWHTILTILNSYIPLEVCVLIWDGQPVTEMAKHIWDSAKRQAVVWTIWLENN